MAFQIRPAQGQEPLITPKMKMETLMEIKRICWAGLAFCAAAVLSLDAQTPPFDTDLLLWFDAGNPADLTLGTGGEVTRWNNRAGSDNPIAVFTAPGKTSPVYQPASDSFGGTVYFDGDNVMEVMEETSPGIWELAAFTTDIGFSVFVVSRGQTVDTENDMSWQTTFGWTQNSSYSNGVYRAFKYNNGGPMAYPEGDCHFYYGGDSPVTLERMQMGSKTSSTGGFINVLEDVEIAEVLVYQQAFTRDQRDQILIWLNGRHGLSTDTTNPVAGQDPRITPLKAYVPEDAGFRISAAGNTNFYRLNQDVSTNPALARYVCTEATLERHYQMITPTNDFKMSLVAPTFASTDLTLPHDWTVTDPYIEWAHERGIDWHGHVLIWHRGIPAPLANYTWLDGLWTEAQLRTLLYDHIDKMVSRYTPEGARADLSGTVRVWDVINEAIVPPWDWNPDTDPWEDTLRSSIWHDGGDGTGGRPGLGIGFIAEAFHRASTASGSEDITLLYNDFHAEEINQKSDAIYAMCVDLLDQGVPIDGVGLQMHINLYGLDIDSFKANVQRFRALRGGTFEVHISEIDIGIPGLVTREKLEQQGQLYHDICAAALEAGVQSLCTWGLHDIWYGGFRGYDDPLPFSRNTRLSPDTPYPGSIPVDHISRRQSFIEPKPAFYGMLDALREHFGEQRTTLNIDEFSVLPDGTIEFHIDLNSAGFVDFIASSDLQSPAMPMGSEGDWRSYLEPSSGAKSYSFTDPQWDGIQPRFWRVVFSPR